MPPKRYPKTLNPRKVSTVVEYSKAEIEAYFAKDTFATHNGCRIVDAAMGAAVCEMELQPFHRNAMGNVMGGAIFTLADFTLAVACSQKATLATVSVMSSIEYLDLVKGTRLIGKAHADRTGRSMGFYTIDVFDDAGTHVARMTSTIKHLGPRPSDA